VVIDLIVTSEFQVELWIEEDGISICVYAHDGNFVAKRKVALKDGGEAPLFAQPVRNMILI